MHIRPSIAAIAAAALLGLGACASADSDSDSTDPTSTAGSTPSSADKGPKTPEPSDQPGQVVEITIEGDSISPNGERIDAELGEPITLKVTSDRAGELHVHTAPSQEFAYGVGTSKFTLVVDRPGIVEVEDHDAGLVVVQLQVS